MRKNKKSTCILKKTVIYFNSCQREIKVDGC